MTINPFIQEHAAEFVGLRRDLHAHPELGSAYNVLPEVAQLAGTLRYFEPQVAPL